jgi:hypothetical protein
LNTAPFRRLCRSPSAFTVLLRAVTLYHTTACFRYRREPIIFRFTVFLLHQWPYHISTIYANNRNPYEFWVVHAADFHTAVSIYVLNADSMLLRNSGYHMNLQRTMWLYVPRKLQLTSLHVVITQKAREGEVQIRHYVMSDGTEHYEKQFVRSKNWRQSNTRGER